MRFLVGMLVASAVLQTPPPAVMRPVGTMSDLMVKILYPASDAIFYITTRAPKTDVEWNELEGKALMLAETANLLMMPSRARDRDQWMQDAKLLLEAGGGGRSGEKERSRGARGPERTALPLLHDLPSTLQTQLRSSPVTEA